MVFGFLLHDSSDVSIGGVSGERKLSIWGGVLEWHRRCQEVFGLLESLLAAAVHGKVLAPPPSVDQSKVLGLEHNLAKNGSKSLPCQESVVAV